MSQSKRHHHSSPETKSQRFWRNFLAFILFLSLAGLSLAVCVRVQFISPQSMVNTFCDREYISALQENVLDYAHDLCEASSIPTDSVDNKITFDAINNIEEAYISGAFGSSEQYTATTYIDYVDALGEDIASATSDMLKKYGIEADEDTDSGEEKFAENLAGYIRTSVEFPYMDELQTVVNIGSTASLIAIIVLAVFSLLIGLIVPSIGNKTYRSLREVAYAFTAAGLLDLTLIAGVKLVSCFKSLVLYPTYLAEALIRYVNRCLISVGLASGVLLAAALVIITAIWKIKRNNNA